MIKIIKWILFSITWNLIFKGITKINYKNLFDNFVLKLLSISYKDIFKFLIDLILNRLTENSILNKVCLPFGLNFNYLLDNNIKKFLLLSLTLSIMVYRWAVLMRKLLLWPFF